MPYFRMLLARVNDFTPGSLSSFRMVGSLGQSSAICVCNILIHFSGALAKLLKTQDKTVEFCRNGGLQM